MAASSATGSSRPTGTPPSGAAHVAARELRTGFSQSSSATTGRTTVSGEALAGSAYSELKREYEATVQSFDDKIARRIAELRSSLRRGGGERDLTHGWDSGDDSTRAPSTPATTAGSDTALND